MGHRGMDRRGMGANKPIWTSLLVLGSSSARTVFAQSTGQTVRHHKVAEQDQSFPPELNPSRERHRETRLRVRRATTEKSGRLRPE